MRTKGKFEKLSTQKCSCDRRRNLGKNTTTCSCNLFDVCSWKVHHRTHTTTTTTMAFKKATKKDIRRDGNAIVDEFTRYKRSCFKNYFFTQTYRHRIDLFVAHTGCGWKCASFFTYKSLEMNICILVTVKSAKTHRQSEEFYKTALLFLRMRNYHPYETTAPTPTERLLECAVLRWKRVETFRSSLSGWCPETRKTTLRVSPPSLRNRFGNLIKMKSWNAARVHFTTILGGVFPYEILIAACNY